MTNKKDEKIGWTFCQLCKREDYTQNFQWDDKNGRICIPNCKNEKPQIV